MEWKVPSSEIIAKALTIMVNNRSNLSAYPGTPPLEDGENLKISGGPLYEKKQVLTALAQGEAAISLWTKKCASDVKRYGMTLDDVADLVKAAINGGRFKGSQWCTNKSGGAWAACDSYQVFVRQWFEVAHKDMTIEYYVKFAVGRSGRLLLIVSCHPPQERGMP